MILTIIIASKNISSGQIRELDPTPGPSTSSAPPDPPSEDNNNYADQVVEIFSVEDDNLKTKFKKFRRLNAAMRIDLTLIDTSDEDDIQEVAPPRLGNAAIEVSLCFHIRKIFHKVFFSETQKF